MDKICDIEKCTGCTACFCVCPINCIKMKRDKQGFLFPVIDYDLCLNCHLCRSTCPNNIKKNENNNQTFYAVKSRDDIRIDSSSGGAFSIIALYVLSKGGHIYGASYNEKNEVKHIMIDNIDELNSLRGSKYVQSELGEVFNNIKFDLENQRICLFVGTPCQVAGLKSFLKKKYNNLITCDLICHGVPSREIFSKYLETVYKQYGAIDCIKFRDKLVSNKGYAVTVKSKNGKKISYSSLLQSFVELYSKNVMLRPSCYECEYANLERCGDFTIGDYWGCKTYYPDFDDGLGISLIITNTEKANLVWDKIKANCTYLKIKEEEALQNMLKRPSPKSSLYEKFWDDYNNNGYVYVARKYANYNLKGKIKMFIKKTIKY